MRILSRNNNPLLPQFPELAVLQRVVGRHRVVLDGEIVAVGRDGRPDFGLLQHRRGAPTRFALAKAPVQYFIFDLLYLDGRSLLDEPYRVRRQLLVDLALPGLDPAVQVPPAFFDTEPADLLRVAGEYEIEGILSKAVDSVYTPGVRSRAWIKTPLWRTQEVVIGGTTAPGSGGRAATFGGLLLGAYTDNGLTYIGRVGTGFKDRERTALRRRLDDLRQDSPPFDHPLGRDEARAVQWVRPVLAGEVRFHGWTSTSAGQRLRQPVWRGLRPDREVNEVRVVRPE